MSWMPSGKFKGYPIRELPHEYLAWLVEQDFVREPLVSRIRAEYDRRLYSQSPGLIVNPEIVEELVSAGLRALSKKHHPDVGGSHETMVAINATAEWLRQQARPLRSAS
jgi:Putative quorum-sensing-regulated virulence factor